jgi:hypothetical protein
MKNENDRKQINFVFVFKALHSQTPTDITSVTCPFA